MNVIQQNIIALVFILHCILFIIEKYCCCSCCCCFYYCRCCLSMCTCTCVLFITVLLQLIIQSAFEKTYNRKTVLFILCRVESTVSYFLRHYIIFQVYYEILYSILMIDFTCNDKIMLTIRQLTSIYTSL